MLAMLVPLLALADIVYLPAYVNWFVAGPVMLLLSPNTSAFACDLSFLVKKKFLQPEIIASEVKALAL
ncbi:hypothetical protein ACO0LM_17465 [Undibacterium sp. Di26W]|uniref:hypothetical protein n=1 Tax=Undibacterium sp. Di26W TaxID=3413035 RepID=UPI003BF11489